MDTLSFEQKYALIGTSNASHYEGVFFTAVKTTGIFCRPSCRARKPKIENVEFYDKADAAIRAGYRPCKRCKPMSLPDETPVYIEELIKEIHDETYQKINDQELRQRGLAPHTVRRWFKRHYNMTFQGYQRMMRINCAYQQLSKGGTVTNSALDNGYESLSGFLQRYRDVFGHSPKQHSDTKPSVITLTRFVTPLGPMFAGATDRGLCLLEFTDRRMLETEFADLCQRLNAVILPGSHAYLDQTQKQIEEYFEGKRKQFDIPFDAPTTPFRQLVWQELQNIPYGQTRSYQDQAIALNRPSSVRAVASANGHNRIAIMIPCHRVIGSNGELTGYAGGLERKRYLLQLEKDNT